MQNRTGGRLTTTKNYLQQRGRSKTPNRGINQSQQSTSNIKLNKNKSYSRSKSKASRGISNTDSTMTLRMGINSHRQKLPSWIPLQNTSEQFRQKISTKSVGINYSTDEDQNISQNKGLRYYNPFRNSKMKKNIRKEQQNSTSLVHQQVKYQRDFMEYQDDISSSSQHNVRFLYSIFIYQIPISQDGSEQPKTTYRQYYDNTLSKTGTRTMNQMDSTQDYYPEYSIDNEQQYQRFVRDQARVKGRLGSAVSGVQQRYEFNPNHHYNNSLIQNHQENEFENQRYISYDEQNEASLLKQQHQKKQRQYMNDDQQQFQLEQKRSARNGYPPRSSSKGKGIKKSGSINYPPQGNKQSSKSLASKTSNKFKQGRLLQGNSKRQLNNKQQQSNTLGRAIYYNSNHSYQQLPENRTSSPLSSTKQTVSQISKNSGGKQDIYQMMAPIFHELMNDYMNKNRSRSVSPGALIHQQGLTPALAPYSPAQTFYQQNHHHQLPQNIYNGQQQQSPQNTVFFSHLQTPIPKHQEQQQQQHSHHHNLNLQQQQSHLQTQQIILQKPSSFNTTTHLLAGDGSVQQKSHFGTPLQMTPQQHASKQDIEELKNQTAQLNNKLGQFQKLIQDLKISVSEKDVQIFRLNLALGDQRKRSNTFNSQLRDPQSSVQKLNRRNNEFMSSINMQNVNNPFNNNSSNNIFPSNGSNDCLGFGGGGGGGGGGGAINHSRNQSNKALPQFQNNLLKHQTREQQAQTDNQAYERRLLEIQLTQASLTDHKLTQRINNLEIQNKQLNFQLAQQ